MHCDEVIRELAVPTDDRDSAALAEHSGELSRLRRLGQACRSTRSSLGGDPTDGAVPRGLGQRLGPHLASSLDSSTPTEFETFALAMAHPSNGSVATKVETPPCGSPRVVSLASDGAWQRSALSAGPSRRHPPRRGSDLASFQPRRRSPNVPTRTAFGSLALRGCTRRLSST